MLVIVPFHFWPLANLVKYLRHLKKWSCSCGSPPIIVWYTMICTVNWAQLFSVFSFTHFTNKIPRVNSWWLHQYVMCMVKRRVCEWYPSHWQNAVTTRTTHPDLLPCGGWVVRAVLHKDEMCGCEVQCTICGFVAETIQKPHLLHLPTKHKQVMTTLVSS